MLDIRIRRQVIMARNGWRGRAGLIALLAMVVGCGPSEAAQSVAVVGEPAGVRQAPPVEIDTVSAMRLSAAFRSAAERALPAVVSVTTTSEARVARQSIPRFFPFFDMPDGFGEPQIIPQQGRGSGFIFDESGYVLTNRHVVHGANEVVVTLRNGREYTAEVVGMDASTDVAVLKIEPRRGERFPTVEAGDSDRLQVGDWVLALGNPLGLDFTVTAGIVSAKGRSIGILRQESETALEAFIQTDAAINRGNSGGPLVDLAGRVVGVNTAIMSPSGFNAGYGFAIPIQLARRVASDLIEHGAVRRPRLGVLVGPVTEVDAEIYGLDRVAGAHVVQVQEGTVAEEAGIQIGDVIVALDGEAIDDATELTTRLAQREPGDRVRLTLIRDRARQEVTVRLGEFEAEGTLASSRKARPEMEDILGFRASQLSAQQASAMGLDGTEGVIVSGVRQASPAAAAGVQRGMVVTRLNGREIGSLRDFERAASGIEPGDVVSLIVTVPGQGDRIINYRTRR